MIFNKKVRCKNNSVAVVIFGIALALLALTSCSSGDVAGGTSTETTNGLVVFTSEGTPAVGAFVSVVDGSGWIDSIARGVSPVCEQGFADSSGNITLRKTNGTRTVRIEYGAQSAIVSGNAATISLQKSVPLSGTAIGSDSVRIGGTDLVVPVNSNGSFRFESVSCGVVSVYRQAARTVKNGVVVSSVDTMKNHIVPHGGSTFLFDDFTGGFELNPLVPITGGVEWFSFSDSIHKTYRDQFWQKDSLSFHKGNSFATVKSNGESAHLESLLGSGTMYPYAGFGVRLGNSLRGINLSAMNAITLRLRGTGTVRISIESRLHDSLGISQYSVPVDLESNWKTVTIPMDSFHLAVKDSTAETSYPWKSGASDIRRLEFLFRGAENLIGSLLTCEIDAIYFEGVRLPL